MEWPWTCVSKRCARVDNGLHKNQLNNKPIALTRDNVRWIDDFVAWRRHMAREIWVNIFSNNGLLPDGTWTNVGLSSPCVRLRLSPIPSTNPYAIYGVVYIQLIHFWYDDYENMYTLSYYHHQIICHFLRVRSWHNGMRYMSFYILLKGVLQHSLQKKNLYKECSINWKNKLHYWKLHSHYSGAIS